MKVKKEDENSRGQRREGIKVDREEERSAVMETHDSPTLTGCCPALISCHRVRWLEGHLRASLTQTLLCFSSVIRSPDAFNTAATRKYGGPQGGP